MVSRSPLTALEVVTSRVEGAVIVVELAASMRPPDSIQTGFEDVQRFAVRREAAAREKEERDAKMATLVDLQERTEAQMQAVVEERNGARDQLVDARQQATNLQAEMRRIQADAEARAAASEASEAMARVKLTASMRKSTAQGPSWPRVLGCVGVLGLCWWMAHTPGGGVLMVMVFGSVVRCAQRLRRN